MHEESLKSVNLLLDENPVVSFRAQTGTGKTTLLPLYLYLNRSHRILHVQPKNLAVRSSYDYVSYVAQQTINDKIMPTIGTNVRRAESVGDYFDKNKNINYVTASFALDFFMSRKGSNDNYLNLFDLVILDEATDPSPEYAVLLLLFADELSKRNIVPSLLLTSASQMKGYPEIDILKPYYYSVPDVPHKIQTYYKSDFADLESGINSILEDVSRTNNLATRSVLIFLPSLKEIKSVKETLKREYSGLKIDVYEVSAKIPYSQYDFNSVPGYDTFKIILSTNIMEQSITVRDLVLVIDSMLEIRPLYGSKVTRKNKRVRKYITKSSAYQRRGRTGRDSPGICYRMISEEKYDQLAEFRQSDLHNSYNDHIFADLVKYGFNPFNIMITSQQAKIEDSLQWLIKTGIIDYNKKNTSISISDSYSKYSKLSIPIYGKTLLKNSKITYYSLLAVCVISSFRDAKNTSNSTKYCMAAITYLKTEQIDPNLDGSIILEAIKLHEYALKYISTNIEYVPAGEENDIVGIIFNETTQQ